VSDQQTITAGFGAITHLADIIAHYKARQYLFVTGKNSYMACGAQTIIERHFTPSNAIFFNDFNINPTVEDAQKGAGLIAKHPIDLIIAIGGGSVLDMAKLIKAIGHDIHSAADIIQGHKAPNGQSMPLIAIPTTAGSGSEATHFAVAYIGKKKFSLASPSLLPTHVLLDGQLLASASPYQKAVNGLDALAQSIESCWSVNSNEHTQRQSLKAITQLMAHLPSAIQTNHERHLQTIMLAANAAGQAINHTKTTAPHAFSYALTSYYGIPHGHAVWLTLPKIFALHQQATTSIINDPRGIDHLQKIMRALTSSLGIHIDAESYLQHWMQSIGVEPDMKRLGIDTQKKRQFIAEKVNSERLSNNPVRLTQAAITEIFELG